jgi:hypothetical protein
MVYHTLAVSGNLLEKGKYNRNEIHVVGNGLKFLMCREMLSEGKYLLK